MGAAPRDSFLLPDEGLTSAKKTENSISFAVLEIGEIRVRPPYFEWVLARSKSKILFFH